MSRVRVLSGVAPYDDPWHPFAETSAAAPSAPSPRPQLTTSRSTSSSDPSAANTFHDWAAWDSTLGGRWVGGHSFHPPLDEVGFTIVPGAEQHPVLAGLDGVAVTDERYSHLVLDQGVTPLLQHHHDGVDEVMAWANGRAVYDGMGHDARSYASPDHQRFLVNAAEWLLTGR